MHGVMLKMGANSPSDGSLILQSNQYSREGQSNLDSGRFDFFTYTNRNVHFIVSRLPNLLFELDRIRSGSKGQNTSALFTGKM